MSGELPLARCVETFEGTEQTPPAPSCGVAAAPNSLVQSSEGSLVGFGIESCGLPHAILIECPDEDKADGLARKLAAAQLCSGPEKVRPCGQCVSCEKVEKGIHPDLQSYLGEGKSLAISVDKVRQIRAQAYILPGESERKVLLLRGVQTMLAPAQNALLKILEEPPASAVFILTTTNRFSLLETVRSRVRVISLESEDAHEAPEHIECAQEIIELLSRGEEARVLACFAKYEKDKLGVIQMLTALRGCLTRYMIAGGYKGGGAPLSPHRLWDFAAVTEDALADAESNVGGLLLGCSICARMFEASEMP
ncbi:MAG: hypothetical protein FWE19_08935 [Oscillospiraceae bacterium]|nr:hypothetical protein [Oscillospiraceae bacterium]